MIAGRWFITPHAVRRYQERGCGPTRYEDALADLVRLSEVAHRVRVEDDGIELWRGPQPERLRFVVSTRGPGQPQLLTVKAGHDGGRLPLPVVPRTLGPGGHDGKEQGQHERQGHEGRTRW